MSRRGLSVRRGLRAAASAERRHASQLQAFHVGHRYHSLWTRGPEMHKTEPELSPQGSAVTSGTCSVDFDIYVPNGYDSSLSQVQT